jgi:hypothetical protein
MARGWESKSVESQIDMAEVPHASVTAKHSPDPVQLDLIRRKENILLSRTRVVHELSTAQNPRYKAQLRKALVDLDAQLATIG